MKSVAYKVFPIISLQRLIFFVALGCATYTRAATWYVDKDATGSNNGTSWSNAWAAFSSVKWGVGGVTAGDTLFISGGSTSKTYTNPTVVIGASGTKVNPINLRVGQDAGHSGMVIFDYDTLGDSASILAISGQRDWLRFDGEVNGGSHWLFANLRNINARNATFPIYGDPMRGAEFRYLSFSNCNHGIRLQSQDTNGVSIYKCDFRGIRGDAAITLVDGGSEFSRNTIYSNYIGLAYGNDGTGSYGGPDGVQAGSWTEVHDNYFKTTWNTNIVTSSQHTDFLQMGGTNIKIYNNEFVNIGDSAITMGSALAPVITDIMIYNNVFRIEEALDPLPEFIRVYGKPWAEQAAVSVLRFCVFNNTFIDEPYATTYYADWFDINAVHFSGSFQFKNNLFYNCGEGRYKPICMVEGWRDYAAGDVVFQSNIYYHDHPENAYIKFLGVDYLASAWVTGGIETGGKTNQPMFVNYVPNGTSNNLRLRNTDTAARGSGVDLSAYFTTDKDGNPRGGTWDIGAYQTQTSGITGTPAIAVAPAGFNCGSIPVGGTTNWTFTVQNTGSGTLSGSASVSSPFTIVSGSPYSVGASQNQAVTVRYNPTLAGTNSQSVAFTGGGGVTSIVIGIATPESSVPVANSDKYSVTQGATLTVTVPGVLGNDTGNNLAAVLVSGPVNGTLNLSSNGGFIYSPATNFTGADSFSYRANSGLTNSGAATVSFTVNASSGTLSDDFSRSSLAPWTNVLGTWSLSSAVLLGTCGAGAYGYACLSNNWTDFSVEGQVQFPAGAYGGGLGGRVDPVTGTHYGAWVYPEGSSGGSSVLKLVKFSSWTGWSGTPMQQVSLPGVGTNWHKLKMVFQGSEIQVSYDGTQMIDVTDTAFDGTAAYLSGGISADMYAYMPYMMGVDNVVVSPNGTPALSLTPVSQSVGAIAVGATTDCTFTVQNVGGGTLSGSASVAAPFSVVSGSSYNLGAGQSQAVTVRYSPIAAGTNNQSLAFTGGGGSTSTVSGSAVALPAISLTPASQSFGLITVGTTTDRTFAVQNTGGGTLSGSASAVAPFIVASGSPYNLGAGQSQGVTIRYSPTAAGTNSQSITFTGGGGATSIVSGSAMALPSISITPASQSVGAIAVGTTINLTVIVQNTGGGILSGSASVAAPFSIVTGSPYNLGAGQSQGVTIRYSPTALGTATQTVTFTGGSGANAAVSGQAWAPPGVSAITQSGSDVDPNMSGIQVFAGSVVHYSGAASDPNGYPISWQWIYTVNGGAETVLQSGTGTVTGASFNYTSSTASNTFVWKLRVNNGMAVVETNLIVGVESPPVAASGLAFPAASGVISSPFVVTNGYIYQPLQTVVPILGGRASCTFTITSAGDYVIQGLVNAPSSGANSFFLNIDAEPETPTMIWDIPTTSTFENRVVSWRGNGTDVNNEYVPKIFSLTQGVHQLIIRGREANVQLASFAFLPLPSAPINLRIVPQP